MQIRLQGLKIRNFKGIKELDIKLDCKDINVLGENGTGKTTIKDAFTWMLFGKDSLGRADFGIKPTDENGDVIHHLETSVEALFMIEGLPRIFKRTMSEVWTRKRGAVTEEFTRNENGFYIDGVPKKKMEYTAEIKSIIDEELFKTLTDPLYFNESVSWKERRTALLEICGDVSDEDVIATRPELATLLSLLNGKSVADFKEITVSKMKSVNKELDLIPVKINEAEMAKPSEEDMQVDLNRKDALTLNLDVLREKKSKVQSGATILDLKSQLNSLQKEHDAVGKDFNINATDEYKKLNALHGEKLTKEHEQEMLKTQIRTLSSTLDIKMEERKKLSEKWDAIIAEQFTDSTCPTCHRELPEEELEIRKREFNADRVKRLDAVETENNKLRELIESISSDLTDVNKRFMEITDFLTGFEPNFIEAGQALSDLQDAKTKEFDSERHIIADKIACVERAIKEYESANDGIIEEIEAEIDKVSAELATLDEAIANRALLKKQNERIAELKAQQEYLAAEYNKAESHLYLAEQFTIAKVDMLNERINEKFKYAKFKLFDRQINGGINEVCEVTYNGIPYKDLNNAMRINVGLDVINTMSDHYGIHAPIMIDNAESVNELFHTDAQQIRMYVSKDKSLVFKED